MALKFRNDQVISSLRSAYALKHSGESWQFDSDDAASRNTGDLEHQLMSLNFGTRPLDFPLFGPTRSMRSNSTPHSTPLAYPQEQQNTLQHQILPQQYQQAQQVQQAQQTQQAQPTQQTLAVAAAVPPSTQIPPVTQPPKSQPNTANVPPKPDTSPLRRRTVVESPCDAAGEHTHAHMSRRMSAATTNGVPNMQCVLDSPITGSLASSELAVSQNAKSLMRWKELGLDLGDDSDFEDTVIPHSLNLTRKSSSRSKRGNANAAEQLTPLSRTATFRSHQLTEQIPLSPRSKQPLNAAAPSLFAKRTINESALPAPKGSHLTSMLTSNVKDPRKQYLEAVAGLRGNNGLQYKMHIPGREPIMITVKPDCSTHLAIGYALLKADIPPGDANMYTLRLTEEDGVVDEDFPALDRVRPVASYHSDEFALIKATEAEFRENCKRTPNKVSFSHQHKPPSQPQPQKQGQQLRMQSEGPRQPGQQPSQPAQSGHAGTQGVLGVQQPFPMLHNNQLSKLPGQPAAQRSPRSNTAPSSSIAPNANSHAASAATSSEPSALATPLHIIANKGGETAAAADVPSRSALQPHEPPVSLQRPLGPQRKPSSTTVARPQRFFASSLSGTKFESILVRVYMYPYDPLLSPVFWSDDMATRQTKMGDVFEQMCREKMMDPEMFILRTADPSRRQIDLQKELLYFLGQPQNLPPVTPSLPTNNSASSASAGPSGALYVDIEVVALRNLPGASQTTAALRPRASSKNGDISISSTTDTSMGNAAGGINAQNSGDGHHNGVMGGSGINGNSSKAGSQQDILNNSVLAMQQTFGFYKYPVTRLKVLGGSAKDLVIDGENVHIMPPSDRSMVDQPKTTSFHIRQVVRVKQSRKTETNFSIAIMKPGGPKTYDLECKTPEIAREIVSRLQRLKAARNRT